MLCLLIDTVVEQQLVEADIVVSHLKPILTASDDAVVELLHNSLMLVKSLSVIGRLMQLLTSSPNYVARFYAKTLQLLAYVTLNLSFLIIIAILYH